MSMFLFCFLQINQRGDMCGLEDKKPRCRSEQIKKTRLGPAQEVVKARAMRILKQNRM